MPAFRGKRILKEKSPEAFRTISEVSDELDLPQHVLRFWESKFAMIKPLKRGGGRRYYRPGDIDLLRGIRHLLYTEGFTIKGVQKILRDQGVRYVAGCWQETAGGEPARPRPGGGEAVRPEAGDGGRSPEQDKKLRSVLDDLEGALSVLDKARGKK